MLRESAEATDTPLDLRGVVDDRIDPLVPAAQRLRAFADACTRRDASARTTTRGALTDTLGAAAAATAAGVVANFEMMNRILDATGVPIPRRRLAILRELGRSPDTR